MHRHEPVEICPPSRVPAHCISGRSVCAVRQQAAEVPAPQPDVVPLPPSPHPVPVPPPGPPEIDEPIEPGQHAPVRDPPATPPMQRH